MLWFLFILATTIAALGYVTTTLAWKEIKYHRNHPHQPQSLRLKSTGNAPGFLLPFIPRISCRSPRF